MAARTTASDTKPTPNVKPDPATVREFAELKKDLKREIGALKKDRNSMLAALAQTLATLPASEIAEELSPLDNEMTAQTLRHLSREKREAVLGKMSDQRTPKLRRRLRQLGIK